MKKNSIEKISQRCEYFEDWGMACGPCGISGIIAETVFKENGREYFLISVSVADAGYMLEGHLTADKSTWDYYTMKSDDEDFEEISEYNGEAPIDTYYEEMAHMCLAKMKELDFDEETIKACEADWFSCDSEEDPEEE